MNVSDKYINNITINPPIKGYLEYAFELSILFANNKSYWPWLLNKFMIPGFKKDNSSFQQIHSDFTYSEDKIFNNFTSLISPKFMYNYDLFIDLIIFLLSKNYYLESNINEKFLPNTASYKKKDFYHTTLIYGYDKINEMLFTLGYSSNNVYEKLTISFEDYLNSLQSMGEPQGICFKKISGYIPDFNLEDFKNQLRLYLNSTPVDTNYYNSNEWVFGFDSQKMLIGYLDYVLDKGSGIDNRFFYFLYEHKYLMSERIKYLLLNNYIISKTLLDKYMTVVSETIILKGLNLKYNITRKVNIISSMKEKLNMVIHKEKEILAELLTFLCN